MTEKFSYSLVGYHALVCGASQGIGRAAALALAKNGARVSILARNETNLAKVADEIQKSGGEIGGVVVIDVEDHTKLQSEIEKLVVTKGAINILVNNSAGPSPGPILKAKPEDFIKAMNRLLIASHNLVQILLPGMQAAGYGRIINVISTSVREPIPNLGVSNTIRAATASWAKSIAAELPPGITINNILPGFTDTPRLQNLKRNSAQTRATSEDQIEREWLQTIPEGRLADPMEPAMTIAFLASPAASYIRGQSIAVDGGRTKGI